MQWIRSIVEQCREASVPVFVKQLGAQIHASECTLADWGPHMRYTGARDVEDMGEIILKHPAGANPDEWPEDLRVRQFPGDPERGAGGKG